MQTKHIFLYIGTVIILFAVLPSVSYAEDDSSWWDDNLSFRQELNLPLDTSPELAHYQPVDTRLHFEQSCWGLNEEEHSLRIICEHQGNQRELESQIYDINYSDTSTIESCSIVFLIPEFADGNEQYYIYYNDKQTCPPSYPDHVHVEEAYYYFAPIPGFPFESYYYKITDDGYIVYGVAIGGEFLGVSTSHQVNIFTENTKEVTTPKDGEAYASFDYFYYYGKEIEDFGSTIQSLVSKEILIDGNLMVEFGIVSETTKKEFRTTATYKYYYCPSENRRIYAHVKHEALKASKVTDAYPNSDSCGNIAGLQVGKMRSPSIKELNFGQMLPYMHLYAENDKIFEYALDIDPEYTPEGIWIIRGNDDVDLGSRSWVSIDEGETGAAYALIFDSPNVITSGADERDGIQIKAFEGSGPGLLGLESDAATFYCTRNSYEKNLENDLEVPDDFIVEFDAEFYTTKTGGYAAVDHEAEVFQSLVQLRPSQLEEIVGDEPEEETYTLTTFVHGAPSFPMGTLFSLVTGKNFSYITAELYCDNEFILTDIGSRLPFGQLPNFKETRVLEKITLALGIFDWNNFTFFKKIKFQNLKPGTYIVKIYKENPCIGSDRKYIGVKSIEVQKDTKMHIFCRPECSLHMKVSDQNQIGVSQAQIILHDNAHIIAQGMTTEEGTCELQVPCHLRTSYLLEVVYNGFVLYQESVRLGSIRHVIPLQRSVEIERYDLKITIVDTWGLPPAINLNPTLEANTLETNNVVSAEALSASDFHFPNLVPGQYTLSVQYASCLLEKTIEIPTEEKIQLKFPAEFDIDLNTFNVRGMPLEEATIEIQREEKTIECQTDTTGYATITLPSGSYEATVLINDNVIGKRTITIVGERSFDLITTEEPLFPIVVTIASLMVLVFSAILTLRKKNLLTFITLLIIVLTVLSVVSPWWMLQGSSTDPKLETSTNMFLLPPSLVEMTTYSEVIAGKLSSASLPTIFSQFLLLLTAAILAAGVLVFLHILFDRYHKLKLSLGALILSFFFLFSSLFIFSYAMSELTKIGVGSFLGNGTIDVTIIGQETQIAVPSTWGPGIGFYLCVASIILVVIMIFYSFKTMRKNSFKKKTSQKHLIINSFKKFMPFIGIILLIYLIYDIGTEKILTAFLKISPFYILIAAFLTLPRLLLRNYGWQYILRKQKIFVSSLTSLKIFLIGYFYGSITPGYIGQLMRIPYLKDKTNEPVGKLFVNSIVEEAVHTLSLYVMMILGAFIIVDKIPEVLPFTFVFLLITIIVYAFFIKRDRGEKAFHMLIRLLIPKKFKPYFYQFVDTFYTDFPNVKDLIIPFLVVIPTWIIIYSQIYILGLSLDIEVPYFAFLLLYPIANMVAFIPITSAGLGTREATLIFLFSFYGVAPEKTIVISLAGHLLTDVLTGFYGFLISLYEARKSKKALSDLKNIFQ
jgi:hypothetical protein